MVKYIPILEYLRKNEYNEENIFLWGEEKMALIRCPECGKEISDKAKKCPNCGKILIEEKSETKICGECGKENLIDATECVCCGCPFEDEKKFEKDVVESVPTIGKNIEKNMKKIIIPVVAVVLIVVVGLIIYNVKVVKPKNTYDEAMTLLEKGKYEEADSLLDSIRGYEDVATVQEQLKYESYAYSSINSIKKYLKNPDSYQPYEITFYASMGTEKDSANSSESEISEETDDEKLPVCIMHYGAQNGFGGNTTSYAICTYDSESGEYEFMGSCDSLDIDDYDDADEDDLYDSLICGIINLYRDGGDTIGDIDLSRLKTVLKNDAYSTIKIIE